MRFRRSIAHFYARVSVGVHLRWVQSMYQSSKAEENLMWDRQPKVGLVAFPISTEKRKPTVTNSMGIGDPRRPLKRARPCHHVSIGWLVRSLESMPSTEGSVRTDAESITRENTPARTKWTYWQVDGGSKPPQLSLLYDRTNFAMLLDDEMNRRNTREARLTFAQGCRTAASVLCTAGVCASALQHSTRSLWQAKQEMFNTILDAGRALVRGFIERSALRLPSHLARVFVSSAIPCHTTSHARCTPACNLRRFS